MFHHALVRASEHPCLAAGQAWPGLLSPREEALLAAMVYLPRRRKWLLGRAAAKRLLREIGGPAAPADTAVSVLNRPSGEPYVVFEGTGAWELPISLSHRSEVGLAAAPRGPDLRIGADVETVEPRDRALVRQFFTGGEAELVARAGRDGDAIVARIWSAKEAVLKLLGLGLRLDTRGFAVSLAGEGFPECPLGWEPVAVKRELSIPGPALPDPLHVVWRREGDVVLTVAIVCGSSP